MSSMAEEGLVLRCSFSTEKGAAGSTSLRDNRPRMLQKHEEVSKGKAAERRVVVLAVFFVCVVFLVLFLFLFLFPFWLP